MSIRHTWKTSAIILVLLTAAFATAKPYAQTAKAADKEESRSAEIERRKTRHVRFAPRSDFEARELFLEIEQIARLTQKEQLRHLSRLYHDLAPRYMSPVLTVIISSYRSHILNNDSFGSPGGDHASTWASQLSDAAKALTPEQLAEKLSSRMWLNVGARVRCIQMLKDHPDCIMEWIDADLDSGEADRLARAAVTIWGLELRSYSKRLLEMFLAETKALPAADPSKHLVSSPLGRTLLFLHDPAILPVLLEKVKQDPKLLVHVAGFFQHPLHHKPVDPMLLLLVSSEDRELSYHAAYALAECKDARLAPVAAEFAHDRESRFRWLAGHWSCNLPRRSFLSIRPNLLLLLKDKEEDVFEQALRCFTRHRDAQAGKVILEMLKQSEVPEQLKVDVLKQSGISKQLEVAVVKRNQIPEQLQVAVMQCLYEMAGSQFGYDMHSWGPGNGKNSEAIEQFENWLKSADNRR
jgi:hypothetical protein